MVDAAKPGEGTIVRADFGGGIDQSADAWKVPPGGLSLLKNGRLDKAGAVRKRTGYQPIAAPLADPGAPIAAIGTSTMATVIDRARDNTIDDGLFGGSFVNSRIANECAYVARSYTPGAVTTWTTTGAVSDVIGDVVNFDATAGGQDEAWDVCADGNFIFVVSITPAKQLPGATPPSVTLTLTQYDAVTLAIIDRQQSGIQGYVYPKIVVCPATSTVVVSAITPNRGTAGWPNVVAAANIGLFAVGYSSSGLTTLTAAYYSAGYATDCDWIEATAFQYSTAERYRPLAPYDITIDGTKIYIVGFSTRALNYFVQTYTVGASILTYVAQAYFATTMKRAPIALSIENDGAGTIAVVAMNSQINMAFFPFWQSSNGEIEIVTVSTSSLTRIAWNLTPIVRAAALCLITPGSLTIAQTRATSGGYAVWSGYVEILQWDGATPLVYAHYVHEFSIRSGPFVPGTVDSESFLSSSTPTARAFALSYYATVASSQRIPVRLPLGLGASKCSWLGRDLPSNALRTDFAANYPGNIGTAILCGPIDRRLTLCASPLGTVVPRLLPTAPPRPFLSLGVWHVPHRQALDGSGGFAFGAIRLSQRAPGDSLGCVVNGVPASAGGLVQTLDGKEAAPTAIVDRPYIGAIVQSSAGAPVDFDPGDYLVQAVYAWRDASGAIHRSTPSDPYRLTVLAASVLDTWTIYAATGSFTGRSDAMIEFYVTEPNGTVLRKWFSNPVLPAIGYAATVIRDAGTFDRNSIGLPDLDAPTLYTTGGVLPFVPIPSARFCVPYRNRLVTGGADDARSIYYANAPTAAQAPSFAVGGILRLEHETRCRAAGTVNDKLILFSDFGIYAVYGQFRDETGAGGALSDPESIHDALGCSQPASVVSISPGLVFFGSDDLFYLIDDKLGLQPIGLKVQEITGSVPTPDGVYGYNVVQSVVHVVNKRELRFFMSTALPTPASAILVYNYQIDQWSFDKVATPQGPTYFWGGACYLGALGVLSASAASWCLDAGTSYYDGTTWITLDAKTAWIQPAGSQAYTRFRNCQFLGRTMAPHDLYVQVYTDFDDSAPKAAAQWMPAQLAPVASTAWPEQVKLQIGSQKTQSVKIRILDAPPGGATTGEGPQLIGLALEVLPLGGATRLPATRKR